MPFAIEAAVSSAWLILLAIYFDLIAAPHGSLVFRPSTRLELRHIFTRLEGLLAEPPPELLQALLLETGQRERDSPVRLDEKQRRNVRQPVGVAGRIAALFGVEQRGQSDS